MSTSAAGAWDDRRYREMCEADAPMRLGVISNPFSRTNARTRLYDRLLPTFLRDRGDAIETRTLADLDRALRTLLFERGVNVLGLNGGDGTLHAGVNRLLALSDEVLKRTGRPLPMPKLLFLNGGTLNIVSRATGTKGNPVRTVRHFTRLGRATLGEVPSRRIGLLRVAEKGGAVRHGFVFGSEIVANALELYTQFGEGYAGLARFLVELVAGYLLHTRTWQEHGWKIDPPSGPVSVDGVTWPHYLCAAAATIDLTLVKGVISAFHVPEASEGFFVKLVLETDKGRIIRLIPKLMTARADAQIADVPEAGTLTVQGGYTLDGECFLDRSPSGLRREVAVTRSPVTIEAVRM